MARSGLAWIHYVRDLSGMRRSSVDRKIPQTVDKKQAWLMEIGDFDRQGFNLKLFIRNERATIQRVITTLTYAISLSKPWSVNSLVCPTFWFKCDE